MTFLTLPAISLTPIPLHTHTLSHTYSGGKISEILSFLTMAAAQLFFLGLVGLHGWFLNDTAVEDGLYSYNIESNIISVMVRGRGGGGERGGRRR